MAPSHNPDEVRRIARQFATAEAIEVLETFIRRQNAKIAACRDGVVYGDDLAAYAARLGHQAAKAQALAVLHEVRENARIDGMTDDIMETIEREFSDI